MSKKIKIKESDFPILLSLWKWKMGTTASIGEEFYGSPSSEGSYKRLQKLAKAGLIIATPIKGYTQFAWFLTRDGFNLIKTYLPELKDEGFKSECIEHDYYCSALQRGPWIVEPPENVILVSEQEIRRLSYDHYPEGIPQTSVHRSDGYSLIPIKGEISLFAFEVELNPKSASHYRVIAKFYEEQNVLRTIWLVNRLSLAKYIQGYIKAASPENYLIHNFILLDDFNKNGWNAPIILGHEQDKTLSYLLEYDQAPKRGSQASLAFLDSLKRPYKSKRYDQQPKKQSFNRLPLVVPNKKTEISIPNSNQQIDPVTIQRLQKQITEQRRKM